ncbi:MAG: GTP 3',8-cyclase MoaA [Actinomycetota bacterium]|nr:GTP 3',8-cyclase MoaA [Actinomycetota bacterium]
MAAGTGVMRDLTDSFGRRVRDLRISITDRCNFRCVYCMPAEGLEFAPRSEILSYEEIERIARLFVESLGVEAIRLTGGEPTVRADLTKLVAMLARLQTPAGEPIDLSLTTNGSTLSRLAEPLAAAGLKRVNVSLDSLDPERFAAMTRRDMLPQVLAGIDAARDAGLYPVKVNVVVVRGANDDEMVDFATYGRERGIQPRFIEYMPLDAEGNWSMSQVVGADEIVAAIDAAYPLEPVGHGPEPASRWRYRDGAGEVGVIASVTRPFCGDCDRVRLTAEGSFATCLFAIDDYDLKGPLRSGASDAELADLIAGAVGLKWAGHRIGKVDFVRPKRSMSQIGG